MKTIQDVVAEFDKKFAAKDGLLHDVNGPLEAKVVTDWLTTTLTPLVKEQLTYGERRFIEGEMAGLSKAKEIFLESAPELQDLAPLSDVTEK